MLVGVLSAYVAAPSSFPFSTSLVLVPLRVVIALDTSSISPVHVVPLVGASLLLYGLALVLSASVLAPSAGVLALLPLPSSSVLLLACSALAHGPNFVVSTGHAGEAPLFQRVFLLGPPKLG